MTKVEGGVTPPLKWAGGKRWLVKKSAHLFPREYRTYIEPFFGSGAVFFNLRPKAALLSDINLELINVYRAIRDRPDLVMRYLKQHAVKHSKTYYYAVRDTVPNSLFSSAARTIYLNRTCWNGLYRVNLNGRFNVPIGTKTRVILETDRFDQLSRVLSGGVDIEVQDFECAVKRAKENDFLFVDPPYTIAHKYNGFIKYNEKLFSWDDQVRLHNSLLDASARGALIMVTNASHESILSLYSDFNVKKLNRVGIIAGGSEFRGKFEELVITNY